MIKKDLIEFNQCKNCANLLKNKDIYYCKLRKKEFKEGQVPYEKVKLADSCSMFEDNNLKVQTILKINFKKIKDLLKFYCDLREDYYDLIAIWIIGTWIHEEFEAYPFLFINAMRGSGKTRLLKLMSILSKDGEVMASPTEAVLFRCSGTLCIDEFESVGGKEKGAVRELLNSAYKKGTKIKRMRQAKVNGETRQVVEEFEPYRPIAMANIWGMEEVLGDRCISLTLERSSNKNIIKLIEDFYSNVKINEIKKSFEEIQCSLCSVVTVKNLYTEWNNYITHYTHTTYNTYNYNNYTQLFKKVKLSLIDGRNLELFFPLFIIAEKIGVKNLDFLIKTAQTIVDERRVEEMTESKDVLVLEFVSRQEPNWFKKVSELAFLLKKSLHEDEEETKWLNSKWFGRALKRLNLIKEKKRVAEGIEVILDIDKAKEKIEIFK